MVAIKCIAKSARRKANRIQKRSLKSETLRRRSHLPTSAEMTLQYPPNIPDSRVQRLPRHELQAILDKLNAASTKALQELLPKLEQTMTELKVDPSEVFVEAPQAPNQEEQQ